MYNLVQKKRLDDEIANALDGASVITVRSEEFKDAVISKTGGIIPQFTWEYHTPMDAIHHGTNISSQYLLEDVPYGVDQFGKHTNLLTDKQDLSIVWRVRNLYSPGLPIRFSEGHQGKIRTYSMSGTPIVTRVTDYTPGVGSMLIGEFAYPSIASVDGVPIETPMLEGIDYPSGFLVRGLFVSFDELLRRNAYRSESIQYTPLGIPKQWQVTDDGLFYSLGRTCYFFDGGNITRGIRLNDNYFLTQGRNPENIAENFVQYNVNRYRQISSRLRVEDRSVRHTWQEAMCFYTSPYIYACYSDRTVKYHVD